MKMTMSRYFIEECWSVGMKGFVNEYMSVFKCMEGHDRPSDLSVKRTVVRSKVCDGRLETL